MDKLKYFYGSFFITALGLIAACFVDQNHILSSLYLVVILALLEISLSFDNAVVNAKTLSAMPPVWQKIFIWVGMPIAVFGMRLVFPILLVTLTTDIHFGEVFHLAIYEPAKYHETLDEGLPYICAFGGGFLFMVFLHFFLLEELEINWFKAFEESKILISLRKIPLIHLILAVVLGVIISVLAEWDEGIGAHVAIAFACGVAIHELLSLFNHSLGGHSPSQVAKNGLLGFIYLEVLDASFSFDGVIGAFAISTNIFIIMIGLGIGAMYVRSLTILFVERQTLAKYQYLEHGAHYAIGFLAIILFIKIFTEVPEWLTGTIGISLILIAYIHSIFKNRRV
ncbi:DUF475 domain-containing protein [Francisellaceae bacterium]|nr:DUF475 domain-containing protein [Francisellaceae bacterium]